jgi:FixJ family two-component response regulator
MTIHIVEDDPAVRDSLAVLLENMGHRVACYSDGESFLRAAQPIADDEVIIDLELPGISGPDIIRHLQGRDQPPRIIVISGEPEVAVRKQLKGIAVPHLLRKPLTADDLAPCLVPPAP